MPRKVWKENSSKIALENYHYIEDITFELAINKEPMAKLFELNPKRYRIIRKKIVTQEVGVEAHFEIRKTKFDDRFDLERVVGEVFFTIKYDKIDHELRLKEIEKPPEGTIERGAEGEVEG